jgi:hypothetical protein
LACAATLPAAKAQAKATEVAMQWRRVVMGSVSSRLGAGLRGNVAQRPACRAPGIRGRVGRLARPLS